MNSLDTAAEPLAVTARAAHASLPEVALARLAEDDTGRNVESALARCDTPEAALMRRIMGGGRSPGA